MLRIMKSAISADSVLRKTLSCSAVATKTFVIKDHYEFDQKVCCYLAEWLPELIKIYYLCSGGQ